MRKQRARTFEQWQREQLRSPSYRRALAEERLGVRLGYRIQCLREDLGYSQAQLADRMGTSPRVVSRLESGATERMSLATIRRLAEALNGELVVDIRPRGERSRGRLGGPEGRWRT